MTASYRWVRWNRHKRVYDLVIAAACALFLAVFTGEILDSKCYLGAMKPGDGKGHKTCATRCVTGGIPPMLLVWTPDGGRRHLLLVDDRGHSARGLVLEALGEPVTVTGRTGRIGDLETLAIDAGSVQRLER